MQFEPNKTQNKEEKILSNFLDVIQNHLEKNFPKMSKKIFYEIEKLSSDKINFFNPFQSPTCIYLKKAINMIPNFLSPLDILTKTIANKLIWQEAKMGVPDFFKGGYTFAEIIGGMGLKFSDTIRMGFFLQKPHTKYPLHAHDAEELYFILSGSADWQIKEKKFKVSPGFTIKHAEREEHAMVTSELPLFSIWIWTGEINGDYWFTNQRKKIPRNT